MNFFCALQKVIPQHSLSTLAGKLADSEIPWVKNLLIRLFKNAYNISLDEAQIKNYKEFVSFNNFFTRALEADARTYSQAPDLLLSPADGVVSEAGIIDGMRILQAKGRDYRLDELLPVPQSDWQPYVGGQFATIYLAPNDYHRFHMPCAGKLLKTVYVPGDLFSVNHSTAANVPRLFARNERLVAFFEGDFGPFAMVCVGALIVSGIETIHHGLHKAPLRQLIWDDQPNIDGNEVHFKAGDEFGRFRLGSTVILLWPKSADGISINLSKGERVVCGQSIGRNTNCK